MKNLFKGALGILVLFIVVAIFWRPSTGPHGIKIVAEPGVKSEHLAMVRKTVAIFNNILQQEIGATLERDVTVFVCPSRKSYRQVLQRELGLNSAEAEQESRISDGISRGKSNVSVVHFDLTDGASAESRAYFATAHELFHQLQYQLTRNNMGKSLYWLDEGSADLVGAIVASKLGFQSLDKWKLDQINVLRAAESHVSPQAIIFTDFDKWTTFSVQKQHPYEMSDLMLFYLLKQSGPSDYRSIIKYYRLIGQGMEPQAAFEQTFKVSLKNMMAGFDQWFIEITTQPATIEFIFGPEVPAHTVGDFDLGAKLTRQFLIENWGKDITGSVRLVLTPGKPAFAYALTREFGIGDVEAAQKAKDITGWNAGSTIIIDLGVMTTKQQRIFSIANLLVSRFESETTTRKNSEQLYWFVKGTSDAAAALIVEKSDAAIVAQYRYAWQTSVRRARANPELSELITPQLWDEACVKYGSTLVNHTAALAGLYLVGKYGVGSISTWCKVVKETGSAETAFQNVFGVTTAQFSQEFSEYLNQSGKWPVRK